MTLGGPIKVSEGGSRDQSPGGCDLWGHDQDLLEADSPRGSSSECWCVEVGSRGHLGVGIG